MAAKKAAARSAAAPKGDAKDVAFVQAAYGEAVKKQVDTYFGNCIVTEPEAEQKFLLGLEVIRKARDRAIELVKG